MKTETVVSVMGGPSCRGRYSRIFATEKDVCHFASLKIFLKKHSNGKQCHRLSRCTLDYINHYGFCIGTTVLPL